MKYRTRKPSVERRALRSAEIRAEPDSRTFEAVVLRYGVLDDYNTRFRAGAFTKSLEERLPRIVWAHQWSEPLGRYVDYRDTDTELTLVGEFDDFDAVPQARRAHAQLVSGTIDQFSIGFERTGDEAVKPEDVDGLRGVVDITEGILAEASLVLVGAVPGTKLLAVRSGMVAEADVLDLAKKVADGELTHDEAKAALALIAEEEPAGTPPPEPEVDEAAVAELAALEAEADGLLA